MMIDADPHPILRERCATALAEQGWRQMMIAAEAPGEIGLLFYRTPSRTGMAREMLIVQIADVATEELMLSRAQLMSDMCTVGVVTVVADLAAMPLAGDLSFDNLLAEDGAQRLLAIVEDLEAFAASRLQLAPGEA